MSGCFLIRFVVAIGLWVVVGRRGRHFPRHHQHAADWRRSGRPAKQRGMKRAINVSGNGKHALHHDMVIEAVSDTI